MKKIVTFLTLLVLPQIVFAAGITNFIDKAFELVTKVLIPMAFAFCVLFFFWGVAKYIRDGASSDKAAEEGKKVMLWGLVGIFVAFSIWGIVIFIKRELQIPDVNNVDLPANFTADSTITFPSVDGP